MRAALALLFAGGIGAIAIAPAADGRRADPDDGVASAQDYEFIPADGRFVMARIAFENNVSRGSMRGWGRSSCFGREPPWHHDYPNAERNFTQILRELTAVRAYTEGGNVFELDDERLFQFPIAYMSEPGCWTPSDEDARTLGDYLRKGGFIIFDDFGNNDGHDQLGHLREQLRRVLPDHDLVPLAPDADVFDSFFLIDPPALRMPDYRGQIEFWGVYEDNDPDRRLMLIAGNNGDLGEFWEYVATGFYSVDLANEAYKVGVNYVLYALTH